MKPRIETVTNSFLPALDEPRGQAHMYPSALTSYFIRERHVGQLYSELKLLNSLEKHALI